MTIKPDWVSIGQKKREQRDALIPADWRIKVPSDAINVVDIPDSCGVLTAREIEITGKNDAVDIVEKIRSKEYSAEETTRAFCKRAAIAQQLTNCLTEIFFDQAIERAKELDREQASNPSKPLRPLHGLPISLKDSFQVPGVDSSIGLICFTNDPDDKYGATPQILLNLGAVLYCKTNIPQTLMTADSDNNVFGRTLNPWNKALTAGGSSGGEGALIALRGSVLGVGTDIAGSVRIPALCDGIYSIRPSAYVIPYIGQRSPAAMGTPGIMPIAGPMASSMRACSYFMKNVLEAQPWKYDPWCTHKPWLRSPFDAAKIRVGVVLEDGVFTPWPPVRIAISQATEKLQAAGVQLVPVTLPEVSEAIKVIWRLFALDGCKYIQDLLAKGGEPEVPSVKKINLSGINSSTMDDFVKLNAARLKFQAQYYKLWTENKLDAIIMPGAPTTATPLDEWNSITYTALWNFLDYPAAIIPTGHVLPTDKVDSIETAKHGEDDQKNYKLYTGPEDFKDAPLAVQVVGMKQEDESLTHVADFIDRIVNAKSTKGHL